MNLNFKIIFYFLGFLLLINGAFMFLSALLSFLYSDGITVQLTASGFIVSLVGLILLFLNRKHDKLINKREGYLVVVLGWLLMIFSGTTPYILTETIDGFSNIFFKLRPDIPQQVLQLLMMLKYFLKEFCFGEA